MKKLIFNLMVMAMSLLLVSGLVLAQHSHGLQKSDSLKAGMSQEMMIQKKMGKGMMQGGMMQKKCNMMKQGMMQGQMGQHQMAMHDPIFTALHSAGCPGFVLKFADKLKLTEKQTTDLKALKSAFQKFSVQKNAEIKVANIELGELLDSTNPDFGKIKNKITQIGSLEQELHLKFLTIVQKSRSLLTSEQLKKLTSLPPCSSMSEMK